ncbi:MAG: hypothetical protein R2873_22840 [Caldilineaceae bacterium]
MKTVMIPSDAEILNTLLVEAVQENLILQTEDGREFLLAEIDDFEREIYLTRQNVDLMALLDERRREPATLSLAEARDQLRFTADGDPTE